MDQWIIYSSARHAYIADDGMWCKSPRFAHKFSRDAADAKAATIHDSDPFVMVLLYDAKAAEINISMLNCKIDRPPTPISDERLHDETTKYLVRYRETRPLVPLPEQKIHVILRREDKLLEALDRHIQILRRLTQS